MKILIANRGEIAVRILRASAALNIPTVAVYSKDDGASLHVRMAEETHELPGKGAGAYLSMDAIIDGALAYGCTAIHAGYGFLSENAEFARKCEKNGITFIGPSSDCLDLFGDKTKARLLARDCGIALIPGTEGPTGLKEGKEFFSSLGEGEALMIKAVSGGGGRGMRQVDELSEFEEAFYICQSEARSAFGNGDVYMERLIRRARHIEVQIIGDGSGAVSHLWERECTLQRRNQKIVEIAPSPSLSEALRGRLTQAATLMAKKTQYRSLGTFEFLLDLDAESDEKAFFFLETNPRLQVEHTITEEIAGIDLVQMQIEIARGRSLKELGLIQADIGASLGYAAQCRVNMEEIGADGEVRPTGGTLKGFSPPLGPGIRVDTFGYPGYETNPNFDSLLAKLIVYSRSETFSDAIAKAYRALCEFQIEGVKTNIPFLQNLLINADVADNHVTTCFIEDNHAALIGTNKISHRQLYFNDANLSDAAKRPSERSPLLDIQGPENAIAVKAVMQGTVVQFGAAEGDLVRKGQSIAVLEAMKMQHLVKTSVSGVVRLISAEIGEILFEGQPLMFIEPMETDVAEFNDDKETGPDEIRPDLLEAISRRNITLDEARPEAVERRRKTGQRTARENIADLADPDSFIEYGGMTVAAQRNRLSMDQLLKKSPADGLIAGIGSINGRLFDDSRARCMMISYDYTAMAGTQGAFNHKKMDRMLLLAEERRLPLVLFAEGGGGRPGDVDAQIMMVAGLDIETFARFARLSGLVPLIGVVSGRCFAGNAALLGCCDTIIAARDAKIGMGGPAMIEGGGLGECSPDDIGPIEVQSPNGVVDIVVEGEAEAVKTAKLYLSYFQGPVSDWECADQRELRRCIPENRLRAYDVRRVIDILADTGSVLELRKEFGPGIITAFVRIEGRPFGLTANNSMFLGGAIDSDGADKASRFMQLCDAFDVPMITLSDTPGFMVGPEAEKTAQVRHFSRMFATGASVTIPIFSVILRKGYGLGAMAMVGGGYHRPVFNISWPTGEFGGMGLEGAVKLGFKKELESAADPDQRQALFETMVAMAYEHGKAVNMASYLEIDDVIDPMESRRWIMRGFKSMPEPEKRNGKKRPNIDTW